MTDDPLVQLERQLVRAAERQARRGQRRGRPRTLLLAAAAAVILAVVPAWATGVLSGVFPTVNHSPLPGLGRAYLVASGMTQRGEPWRFELTRGVRFRNDDSAAPRIGCWVVIVGPPREATGGCMSGPRAPRHSTLGSVGTVVRVSAHDPRRYSEILVPPNVALVHVRFSNGRELAIRPLRVDQRKARATGVLFPFDYVGFAYPAGDRIRGVLFEDAHARRLHIGRGFFPPLAKPQRRARVVQSPVL